MMSLFRVKISNSIVGIIPEYGNHITHQCNTHFFEAGFIQVWQHVWPYTVIGKNNCMFSRNINRKSSIFKEFNPVC